MIYINSKTKALIFDCDGTIVDSMKIHIDAWSEVVKKHNFHIKSNQLCEYNGIPTLQILHKLTTKEDRSKFNLEALVEEKEKKANKKIANVKPIIPIVNLIKKTYGKLPMVVISGGAKENVMLILNYLKLTHLFDFIITAEDDHPSKEYPESFTIIADKLDVEYSCCHVFEDGKPGLISAIQAGMLVTDVRNMI